MALRSTPAQNRRYCRSWYQRMRDEGRCVSCGGEPVPGRVRCKVCYDKRFPMVKKWRLQKYDQLKAARMCVMCRAPMATDHVRCQACERKLERYREEAAERRANEALGGPRCSRCGLLFPHDGCLPGIDHYAERRVW